MARIRVEKHDVDLSKPFDQSTQHVRCRVFRNLGRTELYYKMALERVKYDEDGKLVLEKTIPLDYAEEVLELVQQVVEFAYSLPTEREKPSWFSRKSSKIVDSKRRR